MRPSRRQHPGGHHAVPTFLSPAHPEPCPELFPLLLQYVPAAGTRPTTQQGRSPAWPGRGRAPASRPTISEGDISARGRRPLARGPMPQPTVRGTRVHRPRHGGWMARWCPRLRSAQ